jgi:hypothetical protein
MKRGSGGVRGFACPAVCVLGVALAGCGGGSDRLSKPAYRAKLAAISKKVDTAHGALEQGAPKAKTVAQVQTLLRRYATAEERLGDQVSALKAPKDAESANAELARGEHDDAAQIRRLLPKLSSFKSVQQAFGFLQRLGGTKGGHEQDHAIAELKRLGYTSGS